jgi:hypothetical protein
MKISEMEGERRHDGAPFKPDFGLSGAVPRPDRASPPLARACVQSIQTRFQQVPRRPLCDAESYSTPSLRPLEQSPPNRIPMNGVELLYKLRMITNVEIVVGFCQKRSASPINRRATPCFSDLSAPARCTSHQSPRFHTEKAILSSKAAIWSPTEFVRCNSAPVRDKLPRLGTPARIGRSHRSSGTLLPTR